MKTTIPRTAATFLALALGAAVAHASARLPPVQTSGSVEYLSGGIGQSESSAIERASAHWPLTLEFAIHARPRDEFAADVKVRVRDAQGHTALEATSDGPFLLARLGPGHYAVEATLAGRTLHEKVSVEAGHPAKAVFVFPAGTDAGHA